MCQCSDTYSASTHSNTLNTCNKLRVCESFGNKCSANDSSMHTQQRPSYVGVKEEAAPALNILTALCFLMIFESKRKQSSSNAMTTKWTLNTHMQFAIALSPIMCSNDQLRALCLQICFVLRRIEVWNSCSLLAIEEDGAHIVEFISRSCVSKI